MAVGQVELWIHPLFEHGAILSISDPTTQVWHADIATDLLTISHEKKCHGNTCHRCSTNLFPPKVHPCRILLYSILVCFHQRTSNTIPGINLIPSLQNIICFCKCYWRCKTCMHSILLPCPPIPVVSRLVLLYSPNMPRAFQLSRLFSFCFRCRLLNKPWEAK